MGTLPQALFFSTEKGPHISGSPELVGTLPQAPFFFHKKGTHISGSPELVGTLPQAPFFPTKKGPIFLGTDHEGTARKYLVRHGIMRARHGNICHGTGS